ncbi:MAG TPA: heme-binding protein [Candidatus Binatia bacterium]|nr:heme-binding protein [Candidatus Binatia bacterium]
MRNRPTLEPSDVAKMVAAAKAEAAKNGWDVAIAVVTDGGYIAHVERMGSLEGMSGEIAVAKARGAALTKRSTKEWEERLKDRTGFLNFPNLLPIQGGLPIEYQGQCVGGIGVSGRPSPEDEIVARAGLAALG